MARKKSTIESEPVENQDTDLVTEGEMGYNDGSSAGSISAEEFNAESPPAGDTGSGESMEVPTSVLEEPAASSDSGDISPPDGDLPDYGSILQEMGSAKPLTLSDAEEQSAEAGACTKSESFREDDRLLISEGGDIPAVEGETENDSDTPATESAFASSATAHTAPRHDRILTIDSRDEVETQEDRDAIIWHEIQNSYRTRRILTGTLDGVERTDAGTTLAVVNYKGFRVAIPLKEMMISGGDTAEEPVQLHRILNSRLGSEIDFVVRGLENTTRSVIASRRDAMLRKRRQFYMDTNELGEHMIYEGRVVQARVVAVAEKVIRVEVFGVECSIVARGLSWLWIGNAREHYNVGDRVLVRVLKIDRSNIETLSIRVDARSVFEGDHQDNLKKCLPQSRYAGRVTDARRGVVYIRLNNGVNAIAHSCYDQRTPGKGDDVCFAVTRLNEEQNVAVGIITRIIKQNL